MDFHSLPRKDLQFFCKRNQIPANMTNIAMADALKALDIVEGIEEFMNRSPTSVAKNLPSAARTAARRKTTKDQETQPSELVTRSCYVTSKSLAGETDQENRNTLNVIPQSRRRAVAMNLEEEAIEMKPETKTPAARSTRRSQAASCKKDETVQRAYSTRRSVKLLEEAMADLCLKTAKKKEDSSSDSKLEKTEEEAEVVSVRDLNASMEKEWDGSSSSGMKNDPDLDVLYGDLGDITFSDTNTIKEEINGIESNTVPASDNFVVIEEEDETSQEDDFVVVDHSASLTKNQESETEEIKNESETEPEAETEYKTNGDDSGVVVADPNQDSITTVLVADEPKELESDDSEESEEEDEVIESESEWSDFETSDVVSPFETESAQKVTLVADNKNKNKEENLEMVVDNNEEEAKSEADTKKKMNDDEKLKDVSVRQLTKMVKELALKSKQRPQHKYLD